MNHKKIPVLVNPMITAKQAMLISKAFRFTIKIFGEGIRKAAKALSKVFFPRTIFDESEEIKILDNIQYKIDSMRKEKSWFNK